jgi:hypothetical protein
MLSQTFSELFFSFLEIDSGVHIRACVLVQSPAIYSNFHFTLDNSKNCLPEIELTRDEKRERGMNTETSEFCATLNQAAFLISIFLFL